MQPDQEIRDAALVHAVNWGATVIATGIEVPAKDVVCAAEIFAAYIAGGADTAYRVIAEVNGATPQMEAPVASAAASSPSNLASHVPSQPPRVPTEDEVGNVVSLTGRDAPSQSRNPARERIEKMRTALAQNIVQRARVAKAPEHKESLVKEAKDRDLLSIVVKVDGRETPLHVYLESL